MTVYTAERSIAHYPMATPNIAGVMECSYGIIHFPLTNHPQAGDIIELCHIPAGTTIIGGEFLSGQLDVFPGETLDFDIGWADNGVEDASSDGLGNLGFALEHSIEEYKHEVGDMGPLQGDIMRNGPLTFTNKTLIQVTVNVAANVPITGNMSITVWYILDTKVAGVPFK